MRRTAPSDIAPFRRAEALAFGHTPDDIRTEIRAGRWLRLRRGVLVTAAARHAAAMDDRTLHAQDVHALCLAMPSRRPVAAGASAARIHGIPLRRLPDKDLVILVEGRSTAGTHRDGYYLRAARLPDHHVELRHGVRVTTPARTVIDIAAHLGFDDGVVAAEAAYRQRLITRGGLAVVAQELASRPGIEVARDCLEFADAASESVLESVSRLSMREIGIPMPQTQVVLVDDGHLVIRVDFLWPHLWLVGEADGMTKYTLDGRPPLSVVRAEREREQTIRDLGYDIVRWDWRVANNPRLLATRLESAFDRAAERSRGRTG